MAKFSLEHIVGFNPPDKSGGFSPTSIIIVDRMEKTITVNWAKASTKTSKKGKPYTLFQISATDGNLYSQFGKPELEISEGDEVLLKTEESPKKGYFNIEKIISVSAPKPLPKPDITGNGKVPTPAGAKITLVIDEALEKAIEERARARLKQARKIVQEEYREESDYSLYAPIVAAVYSSMYGEEQSVRIAQQKGIR